MRIEKWYSKIAFLLVMGICHSCGSENAPDCFQASGDRVQRTVEVPSFTKITVFETIKLVVKQGEEQEVRIETGANLMNEVSANVTDGRLVLRNENGCNYVRKYGLTTVYVTSPNLVEIRSSTGLSVSSDGILHYGDLLLISESFINPETETTDGTFDMEIDNQQLTVVVNGIAYFKLRGRTNLLNLTIAAGDSRIEAQELESHTVDIDHRGSNEMFVNPQQRISGRIRGYGNVIGQNRPPEIAVEELFRGRLIFRE